MIGLLDVNVLLAVVWPTHIHHAVARRWFRESAAQGWATTPVTEHGFVRLSLNPAVVGQPLSTEEAVEYLGSLRAVGQHAFWPDATEASHTSRLIGAALATHRQVTDAHLIAIAHANGGRLVTLDRRLAALATEPHRVHVIA